ncbi:uncharacterized protein LOC110826614 [Zootermopsis nevadensis]|uniref:uncharacterized protein LOC110826614 n=1 Tax=Zootermopsis nevadensis TaxID=136037 RepID=UPI000B8E80D6|nr:uncharacterized protein LOC110826614 [Zootermopsis nevadensis]
MFCSDKKLGPSSVIFILASFVCCCDSRATIEKRQVIYGGHVSLAVQRPRDQERKGQDLSKVPGRAGVDYPIFHSVPATNFHCGNVPAVPGIYANVETGCQAYHVCHDGREGHQGATFLCSNGTLFNQQEFTCDWWYNVNCAEAQTHYSLNLDPLKNPYAPKPKPEESVLQPYEEQQYSYGRK